MRLVHWGGHFLNFPIVFKSAGKNQKKIKEKREFIRKTSFRPNRFFYKVTTEIFDFFEKLIKNTTLSFPSSSYRENSNHHYRKHFKQRNDNDLSQTILNICYYSKSISRRYLKVLPVIRIRVFFTQVKFSNFSEKIFLKCRYNFFGPIKILENLIQIVITAIKKAGKWVPLCCTLGAVWITVIVGRLNLNPMIIIIVYEKRFRTKMICQPRISFSVVGKKGAKLMKNL
ncbi:Uncharacterized protein FWK35_00004793, partial [Aphis craccivora]